MPDLTSESAEDAGAGGVNWHVLAGLGVLAMFVPRWWTDSRFRVRRPPEAGSRTAEKFVVRTVHLALLPFVVVQPVLGILLVRSESDPLMVPITSWQIPPLPGVGEGWKETLEACTRRSATFSTG